MRKHDAWFWNTQGFDLDYNSCRMKFLLAHLPRGACCVFGGDCPWRGPEPSFVLVLPVPLSWVLFVKEWRGCYPFGPQYKHNWLVHEKSEQWEGRGPTDNQRAHPTGALHHLHRLYGKGQGEWKVGRRRRDGGVKGWENWGLEAVKFCMIKTETETGLPLFRAANIFFLNSEHTRKGRFLTCSVLSSVFLFFSLVSLLWYSSYAKSQQGYWP